MQRVKVRLGDAERSESYIPGGDIPNAASLDGWTAVKAVIEGEIEQMRYEHSVIQRKADMKLQLS
jgi:hypothetical protein